MPPAMTSPTSSGSSFLDAGLGVLALRLADSTVTSHSSSATCISPDQFGVSVARSTVRHWLGSVTVTGAPAIGCTSA
jgi:hypothetical protein